MGAGRVFRLWVFLGSVVTLGLLFVATIMFLRADAPGPAQPKVTWPEKQITVTLSPGESWSKDVTLTSTPDLQNATVEPVPELSDFVTVAPSVIANLPAGQLQPVHLAFSIPEHAALGTYEGTIHVRVGRQTVPSLLKLAINVAWASDELSDNGVSVSFKYPISWTQSLETPTSLKLFSAQAEAAISAGDVETPSSMTINVLDNPSGLAISEFVHNFRGGWYATYKDQTGMIVDGRQALLASDLLAEIPGSPELALFIEVGSKVVLVAGHSEIESEFYRFIESLEFN